MYFDWTYVVIVLPLMLLSFLTQLRVKTTFAKYQKVFSVRGLTADQAARRILCWLAAAPESERDGVLMPDPEAKYVKDRLLLI